jgi:hypothetical protein
MVRVGDDLYVRSARGATNPWFVRALRSGPAVDEGETTSPQRLEHQSGLNGPLWCMMGAPENEVASGELSVADCVNVVEHEKGHHGE